MKYEDSASYAMSKLYPIYIIWLRISNFGLRIKILPKFVIQLYSLMRKFIAFLILLFFFGCDSSNGNNDPLDEVLVQFNEHELKRKELQLIIPENVSERDSVKLAKAYIDNWLKKKAVFEQAYKELTNDQVVSIEEQIKDYKQDLIVNSYNNKIIDERLNSDVSDDEIIAYYEKYEDNFPLTESIVKYELIKIPLDEEQKADELFLSMKNGQPSDLLLNDASQLNMTYNLVSQWRKLDDLIYQLPQDNIRSILWQNHDMRKFTDQEYVYLVKIIDFKETGTQAPYDFVKQLIKNLIINKRKLNLLNEIEDELLEKAKQNKEIKIYEVK